ncbi:MAG: NUDIX hydrolase [Thermodesulfobacteriota bacterium]
MSTVDKDKSADEAHSGREISAGGVVFKRRAKIIEIALISVKGGKRWGLPKGLQEDGETLARTAHREVKEETGLDGRIIEKLDRIEYFYTFKDEFETKKVFKIVYFFLMEYLSGDTDFHDDEVDECRWFEVDEAISLLTYPDERRVVERAKELILEM